MNIAVRKSGENKFAATRENNSSFAVFTHVDSSSNPWLLVESTNTEDVVTGLVPNELQEEFAAQYIEASEGACLLVTFKENCPIFRFEIAAKNAGYELKAGEGWRKKE